MAANSAVQPNRGKKAMSNISGTLLAVLLGVSLFSVPRSALAFVWGQPVTITGYYTYDSGPAYIETSGNQNPDNCASSDYLFLDTTQPEFAELYATIMTAQATGQTVVINYNGCSSGGYPIVHAVAVPHN